MKKLILFLMLCISTISFGQVIQKGGFNRTTTILDSIQRYAQVVIHSVDGPKSKIKNDSVYMYNVPTNAVENSKAIINMDKRLNTIQYNLLKYHQEVQTSYCFLGASIGLGLLSSSMRIINNDDVYGSNVILVLSGVSALTSTILYIDSYKWIKRASIGTNLNGVAITIDF